MDLAVIPFLTLVWVVNTGLNLVFFNNPPPPPQHKICYVEELVDNKRTLIPYECLGGKSE